VFLHSNKPPFPIQILNDGSLLILTSQLGTSVVPMLTVKLGGGNNIFAEDAPPQPLSEVINIVQSSHQNMPDPYKMAFLLSYVDTFVQAYDLLMVLLCQKQ